MSYNNTINVKNIIYNLIIYLIYFNIIQTIYNKNNLFNKEWIKTISTLILSNIIYNLILYDNSNKYIKTYLIYFIYEYIIGTIDNKPYLFKERFLKVTYLILSFNIYDLVKNMITDDTSSKKDVLKPSLGFLLSRYLENRKIVKKDIFISFSIIIINYIVNNFYN